MKFVVILLNVFSIACTHTVHNLKVEEEHEETIDYAVKSNCGDRCWKSKCWWETEDVIVCGVVFSFISDGHKRIFLSDISRDIEDSGLNVGFCGRDSFATHMTAALIGGVVGGLASAAVGGNVGDGVQIGTAASADAGVQPVHFDERLIVRACSSTPVMEKHRSGEG